MIFEEQFPVPRYTAASKMGNSVISVAMTTPMPLQPGPDKNKFSSLSNTTMVAIFPKLCFWRRSLCSNLAGIDPEKLYRATLTSGYRVPSVVAGAIVLSGTLHCALRESDGRIKDEPK